MKMIRMAAVAALIVGIMLTLHVGRAQQPEIKRTDALRHDLGIA
jgi:hypothetical protein